MSTDKADLPRLLVAGSGPLPPEAPERLHAPGVRIWGIARELARSGHAVRLATIRFRGDPLDKVYFYDLTVKGDSSAPGAALEIRGDPGGPQGGFPAPRVVELGGRDLCALLLAETEDFSAQAVIGSSELMNRELGRMETDLPLWCDYFGDPMAERQMLARLDRTDRNLTDQWETLAPVLRRADRLSGCSRYQVGALLGELASMGRLNQHTVSEQLVSLLPPWIEGIEPTAGPGPFLRGVCVPQEAIIAVQTGGFNTWLDVDTLFNALEAAMGASEKLHFAATGGPIAGHNEETFGQFEALIARSPHRDRYHLLGWLPLGQVPRILAESDLAINVDRPSPEGWLGTRTRLLDWIAAGLPVVSTEGTELVQMLAERELIFAVAQGDSQAVGQAIGRILDAPSDARERARAARVYLEERFSPSKCLESLICWARDPKPALDLQSWRMGESCPPALWSRGAGESGALGKLQETQEESKVLAARIEALEGSRLIQAASWLRRRLGRP